MKTRQRLLIGGGIAGALIGVAAAFLYIKANESQIAAEEAGEADAVKKVSPGEAMTVGLSLLGVLRQIANLGQS
ncbi:MAG: hypothetical protein JXA09_09540 [Anaerolineae bacterium]|nr:hypothetical protein [Anaerolineae bacterium]